MRVLAIEPYYGGSHRAFLDGWAARSRHAWTLRTLPAHHWKWRMRHAPLHFARTFADAPKSFDALVCSDMLDLPTFRGLAPRLAGVPALVYFHENQLTYPVRRDEPRDVHFAFTNIASAAGAQAVWFNSAFHRDAFLPAARALLGRMPDHAPLWAVDRVAEVAEVRHPPIEPLGGATGPREPGPLRIVWAARWEHDKGPDALLAAIRLLCERGAGFELSVLGEHFAEVPDAFGQLRELLGPRARRWGYLPDRADYANALREADVFISTAEHEFFGLAAVEAVSAGAHPLLPDRLAYPEVLSALGLSAGRSLYSGAPADLAERLAEFAGRVARDGRLSDAPDAACAEVFAWARRIDAFDDALERLTS